MDNLALQSIGMRTRGIGWRAERCADPPSCELHLCIADHRGAFWHPADPLTFARWRIRADVDAIPAHVAVRMRGGSWEALRRGVVLGVLGLGGTAAVLGGMWWGRQRRFSMKTLSGSGL